MISVEEKLRRKTNHVNGCWIYLGQPSARYADVKINNKRLGIHRWSYEHFTGRIPEGFQIDHICKNTKCWNPSHLRTVTPKENQLNNWVIQKSLNKTHCNHGHELKDKNIYWYNGHRRCKKCRAMSSQTQWLNTKKVTLNETHRLN